MQSKLEARYRKGYKGKWQGLGPLFASSTVHDEAIPLGC